MAPTLEQVIQLLSSNKGNWLRVNEEICVHRYFGDYYMLLCHWFDANIGSDIIYIEVDDVRCKKENVIEAKYLKGTTEYSLLKPVYEDAIKNSHPATRHTA